jgi:probable blue pigment (indigoidine) exporter
VVATALGWIALGEHLTPLQAVGGLIVLCSVIVASRRQTPPAKPSYDASASAVISHPISHPTPDFRAN